jgi:Divergent InlB B-repeat domain
MKRSKLYLFAIMLAGIALSRSAQGNDVDSVQLMVTGGTGTGSYAPGTMVIVSARAPSAEASFVSWAGDVEILANSFLPKTAATVPLQNVAITAVYVQKGIEATVKAPLDNLGVIVKTLIRERAASDGRLRYLSARWTQP